jgi:hypothetical protein
MRIRIQSDKFLYSNQMFYFLETFQVEYMFFGLLIAGAVQLPGSCSGNVTNAGAQRAVCPTGTGEKAIKFAGILQLADAPAPTPPSFGAGAASIVG